MRARSLARRAAWLPAIGFPSIGCNAILGNKLYEYVPDAAASDVAKEDGSTSDAANPTPDGGGSTDGGSGEAGTAGCDGSSCTVVCDPGYTNCSNACVKLGSDPANCGRCGHACTDSTCGGPDGGVCQPTSIATAYYATALTVDSTSVYWTESQSPGQVTVEGAVKKAPLAGGGGSYSTLANNQSHPGPIAVNASGAFWLNTPTSNSVGGLMWLAPGTTSTLALATSYHAPVALALSSSEVFWLDDSVSGSGHDETLQSLLLTGLTASTTPTSLTMVAQCAIAMTEYANNLYWLQSGCCCGDAGFVAKAPESPLGAGADLFPSGTFVGGPFSSGHIAVDSQNVYFGYDDGAALRLASVPIAGGSPTVRTGNGSPIAIAVDATNIYWVDQSSAILSIPIAGGAVTTLATGQNNPVDVAVDAKTVYWVNNANPGDVMKVAKP